MLFFSVSLSKRKEEGRGEPSENQKNSKGRNEATDAEADYLKAKSQREKVRRLKFC